MKSEQHCSNSNTGIHTQFQEKALVTIPIKFMLSAISAVAGPALTLQAAPVHRAGSPAIKWPGPAFFVFFLFKQRLYQVSYLLWGLNV